MKLTASGREILEEVFVDAPAEIVWGEGESSEPCPMDWAPGVIGAEVCLISVEKGEVPNLASGDSVLFWQDGFGSMRVYLPATEKKPINGERAFSVTLPDGSKHVVRFRYADNSSIISRLKKTFEFDLEGVPPLTMAGIVLDEVGSSMARWAV